jgi:energy-coupling factor transporter ATP-binding protein EcfA2
MKQWCLPRRIPSALAQLVIKRDDMDDVLLDIVLQRLEQSPLEDQATNLLLAAFESEDSLFAQLGGQAARRPSSDRTIATRPEPAGAYLRSLTVSGFRGIGPPATLKLEPGPGLTVVVGRNGSGKSSFAEALEVLLTGELRRWAKLPVVWRRGWRSMHHPEQAEITAEFLVQDAGPAVVQRTWRDSADFARSSVSVQVAGEKKAGLERLGWSAALVNHRPFLAHGELEAFWPPVCAPASSGAVSCAAAPRRSRPGSTSTGQACPVGSWSSGRRRPGPLPDHSVWIRTHDDTLIRAKSITTLQATGMACMPSA